MEQFSYRPRGVCSQRIDFELEGDIVRSVKFLGGCPGNLQAVAALVKDMDIASVKQKLGGIRCGMKNTSCADQFVQALEAAELERQK